VSALDCRVLVLSAVLNYEDLTLSNTAKFLAFSTMELGFSKVLKKSTLFDTIPYTLSYNRRAMQRSNA